MAWIIRAHRRLIDEEGKGPAAKLSRWILRTLSVPYGAAIVARNAAFDAGWGVLRAPLPVVSIGNITAGGVGKTPFVETICRWLIEDGVKPVIISRGYGGKGGPNDEALLLAENLPVTPHLQNRDRWSAVEEAARLRLGNVAVLDDGFQHRRLHRDLDIALLDATDPFGRGTLLPAGLLREPPNSLRRADAVVLTRCSLVSDMERFRIREKVAALAPKAIWAEIDFQPVGWRCGDSLLRLEALKERRVMAFCGIGNPTAFRRTVEDLGVIVAGFEVFPDHHAYSLRDFERLTEFARRAGADALVATQKDAVKIPAGSFGSLPLYSLRIETRFLRHEAQLRQLVRDRVNRNVVHPSQVGRAA